MDKKRIYRKFEGEVVSDKMEKTAVVRVDNRTIHPKYKKRYVVSKRLKCQNPDNKYKLGDKVEIIECRPLSKDKRWRISKKI